MAKTLWLLRHGDAEDHGAPSDFERRLTARGERQSRAAGQTLKRLGVNLEQVFTSPRVRALDTARLACEALALEPIVHQPLAGEFDAEDAAELIAVVSDGGVVLLVGHEPDMSDLVRSLTGARIAMKKGGLAEVALAGGHGELVRLLRPREIEFLAGR
jgi:phosphohistidine phosphatase